jgi:hypothetical protein
MRTRTIEQRVTGLEELVKPLVPLPGRVKNLETNAGPGQNEALSANIVEFRTETNAHFVEVKKKLKELGVVQDQQTRLVQRNAKLIDDQLFMIGGLKDNMREFQVELADFKTEVTDEITTLKTDVSGLKTDVSGLKGDMTEVKADVAGLKGELTEFKLEVRGTLAEILDRLPPRGE